MRVLLWVGNESNQIALATKIAEQFNVVGIVSETRKSNAKLTFKKITEKIIEKIFLASIGKSWTDMKTFYGNKYPNFPDIEKINVENINNEEAFTFSKNLNPDLIIVSGTRLVKDKMLSISVNKGILNLHTGLSPYIKGGPNCTNWCIATNQFEYIGNTIMWIDKGIDTGNIVTTECTPLSEDLSLFVLHKNVMEHAHELYLKAIKYISEGKHSNFKQKEVAKGKTYYTKQWDLTKKFALNKNFRLLKNKNFVKEIEEKRKAIKTILLA